MPKATIYIRVKHWKYWQAIIDKSAYVNGKLLVDAENENMKRLARSNMPEED